MWYFNVVYLFRKVESEITIQEIVSYRGKLSYKNQIVNYVHCRR